MKKSLVKWMLVCIIAMGASLTASAQVYVHVRPVAPKVVMTARPSADHVWIAEDWNEDHGNYKYAGGRWETPPHHGDHYNAGHWNHDKDHGDNWVRGGWKGGDKK